MISNYQPGSRAFWACAALTLAPRLAAAGEFSVSPIRLELGGNARSGAIVVRNDDSRELSFQIRGKAWSQDGQAADVYVDATDLIYFPKLLVIAPGSEAVIRIGLRQPLVQREQTYRLFIEELPVGEAPAGSRVRVLMRFGVPVFVVPVKPQNQLDVEEVSISAGVARVTLANAGNQHQIVDSIDLTGADRQGTPAFTLRLADRYLLAGTRKTYKAAVPRDQCLRLATLVVEAKTDKAAAKRQADVDGSMCQ